MNKRKPTSRQTFINRQMSVNKSAQITAVTGMGAMCSLGMDLKTSIENMFSAPVAPAPPTAFSTDHPEPYPVFSLPEELPQNLVRQDRDLSLTARMAVVVAGQALADAGLTPDMLKEKTVGVCMGTTVGASLNDDPFYISYRKGENPEMDPIRRFLFSNPARAVAREFSLKGPVQTVVNACASGADAVGIGAQWIKAGICDMVIAGGTDELCKVTYNGFISLMITDPALCKPFDVDRRGLNLGEGAAALILEPATDATEKISSERQKSYVNITGYGTACDAYHLTAPRPDARGLMSALDNALLENGTDIARIGFINAHGTGTRDNDRMEMTLFKEKLPGIPFLSTKGYTGHTLGAAGALEAVFTIACLNRGEIPGSRGFSKPDPDFGISPVTLPRKIDKSIAISQSAAFGGNNTVLIFSRE